MIVKTVFMLRPLEARNAVDGTDTRTLQLICLVFISATIQTHKDVQLSLVFGILSSYLRSDKK